MEEHFKNKLKNHKVDWDKEALLGDLKQELAQDKSRFDWRWFLLIPLLLIGTCWGWNNYAKLATEKTTSMRIAHTSTIDEKENKTANHKTKIETKNQSKKDVEKNVDGDVEDDLKNTLYNPIPINPSSKSQRELNRSVATIQQEVNSDSNAPKNNTETNFNLQKPSFPDLSKTDSSQPNEELNNELYTANEKTVNSPLHALDKQASNHVPTELVFNIGEHNDHEAVIDEARKDMLLLPIPIVGLTRLNSNAEQKNLPILNSTDSFPEKEEDDDENLSSQNPFYISGSGELGLFYRSRIFDTSEDLVNLLEQNEETETSLFTFTSNLNVGYQHSSGWSFQTGMEYTEMNEVFNFKKITTEPFLRPTDKILYFIVENLDTLLVLDTVNVIRTTERTVRHYNKHSFYSVPLQVGYQFNLKKAKLTTRLGLSYTFVHNFTGRTNFISEANGSMIIDNSHEIKFELKNRIGLQAGLALEYPFLKRSQIFATATYRKSPNLNIYVIEQSYHSISIGTGLKFALGK